MLNSRPRIKPSHPVIYDDDGNLSIGEIPGYARIVKKAPEWLFKLLNLLDGSKTLEEIHNLLLSQDQSIEKETFLQVIKELNNSCFLENMENELGLLTETEKQLYDRQMLYFSLVERDGNPGASYQEKLKQQHVLVLGAGGWGTWMTLNLSLCGFGEITLVDGDAVELSNLNRQVLYHHENIGTAKVHAAQTNLRKINPTIKINTINKFLRPEENELEKLIPHNCTLIVLAWENLAYFKKNTLEESIHKLAYRLKIPIIEIGADPLSVSVGPLYVNDHASLCFECVLSRIRQECVSPDNSIQSLRNLRIKNGRKNLGKKLNFYQNTPSLSIMSGLVIDQLVKFVTSCEKPLIIENRFNFSLQTYQIRTESFQCYQSCLSNRSHKVQAKSGNR